MANWTAPCPRAGRRSAHAWRERAKNSTAPRAADLRERVARFQRELIEPAEAEYFAHLETRGQRWTIPPVMETLKAQARAAGLWNLFLPDELRNLDYAPLAEIMGRSLIAPEV